MRRPKGSASTAPTATLPDTSACKRTREVAVITVHTWHTSTSQNTDISAHSPLQRRLPCAMHARAPLILVRNDAAGLVGLDIHSLSCSKRARAPHRREQTKKGSSEVFTGFRFFNTLARTGTTPQPSVLTLSADPIQTRCFFNAGHNG